MRRHIVGDGYVRERRAGRCTGCPARGTEEHPIALTRVGEDDLCIPCYRRLVNRQRRAAQREAAREPAPPPRRIVHRIVDVIGKRGRR
jgi:hypothetical protein